MVEQCISFTVVGNYLCVLVLKMFQRYKAQVSLHEKWLWRHQNTRISTLRSKRRHLSSSVACLAQNRERETMKLRFSFEQQQL